LNYKFVVENVFGRLSLNGIADIFPQTSQITSGELFLSFFVNNPNDELGMVTTTFYNMASI